MAGAQVVLVVALFVGLAHSWDVAVTVGNLLEFYTTDGNRTDIKHFKSQNLTALAYDEVHNMLLYVSKESDNDAICGYNIKSVKYQCYVQRNGRNIQGLAFDPVTELLFFTDTKERSINSFSFKSGSKNNVYGNLVIKMDDGIPTDIAVDQNRGYIYWINTNLTTSTIERARLDGSEREVVINATYNLDLHSLAIGQETHEIYWVEPETPLNGRVYSADSNGNNWVPLIDFTIDNIDPSYSHPNALTVSKNNLFMTGWCATCGPQSVWKVNTEIQTVSYHTEPLFTVSAGGTVGIVANTKLNDQEISDNIQAPNAEYEGLFCIHGTQVTGQLLCKCAPGYNGERCEVSVCENYCLHGNCSFTEEGLPECRCDAGYTGPRCEIYACYNYCVNGSTCSLNELGQPVCTCTENYEGERCEEFDFFGL